MIDGYSNILNNELHSALMQDRRIKARASRLRAALLGRRIVLEGEVEDIPSKRIASNLVSQLVGDGYRLHDRVRVRASDINDLELRYKAARALLHEPLLRDCNILVHADGATDHVRGNGFDAGGMVRVEASDGVVTLTGQTSDTVHQRLAEVLIWWIDGCERVDNLIEIFPPKHDTDEELGRIVRIVLERDPFVADERIRVDVNAGVVELTGGLPGQEQVTAAVRDAWAVPGVWEVYDRLGSLSRSA